MNKNKALNIGLIITSVMVIGVSGTLLWRHLANRRKLGGPINDSNLPRNFAEIPGGKGNYRTDQPTLEEFKYIFEKYPKIKNIIRMNGEEGTGVTVEAEKKLAEEYGKNFMFMSAHKGYEKGKGYIDSINNMLPYLKKGNTLIHCTHGADRTGYIVAKYLQDIGFRKWDKEKLWDYTISYNTWEDGKICNPGTNKGYIKYLEGFYPMDEWCNAQVERKNCSSCREYI